MLGHAEDGAGQVDEAVEALLAEEQDEYGDLIRLHIAHGENMNEGKTLDWLRAVGTGQDGGREAWWLFKVDDDVSPRTRRCLRLCLLAAVTPRQCTLGQAR